jgi:hypothetical protein
MTPQEIELWTREIVASVIANRPVEDSTVELKANWPEPEKAASRLAGHANAARGAPILWLIGVDEKGRSLTVIDYTELETWYKSMERWFDGYGPRLLVDVNVRVESSTVVALFFETQREAPYVVTSSKGGYPDFIVPWREGTRLRAARREELLSILIPIQRFSALCDELEFNLAIARSSNNADYKSWGCLFREEEFHKAMRDGAISSLPVDVKQFLHSAYIAVGRANQRASGALSNSLAERAGVELHNVARQSFVDAIPRIEAAYSAISGYLHKKQ